MNDKSTETRMTLSERALAEENRRAGRVIPSWRYFGALLVTFYGGWEAHVVYTSWGWGWTLIPIIIASITFASLLERYKAKALR